MADEEIKQPKPSVWSRIRSFFYIPTNAPFSNTVFTDANKREITRYKRYFSRVQKYFSKKQKKPRNIPVLTRFKPTVEEGLSSDQVRTRVRQAQINFIKKGSTKSVGRILFTNLFTWFNILAVTAISLLVWVGAYSSTYFVIIVVANTLIGIIQELKAKFTIEKLSLISRVKTTVVRDGEKVDIAIDDVALDDILILSTGKQVPADCVIMDGTIEVNESLLTGESVPIQKGKGDMLLAGSYIVSGTCHVRAEKVGSGNYVQKLAKGATKYVRPRSELLGSLRIIIRTISFFMVVLASLYIIRQIGVGVEDRDTAIVHAIGAVIGMIPSGMFLLTSMALAVGVINLAKARTLVQELYCIEMLARVDTLCLDKTGTITNGTMKVCDVVEIKNSTEYTIREIISSMQFALQDNNQTAIAIQDHFGSQMVMRATNVLPFSSSRKLSAVTFADEGTYIIGAPEFICKEGSNVKIEEKIRRFASQGYRVLILAHSKGQIKNKIIPSDAKPMAIITLQDNIRADAPATINWFKENGVDVRVISGDNPITVSEVAKRAGVEGAEKYISLEGLSPIEVRNIAQEYTVFGRVSPEQKLILVKELKNARRTVAMTGDGVNDILALREADCSIAMAAGSEAARNVSHLVLLDNDFAALPKVVAQGRRVINNIQKTSSIYLFKTMFVMLLVVFSILTGMQYPFQPINMLLIEFFVIGLPTFAIALEINDKPIKGKFLLSVLRNALSGAVVIIINVTVLFIFQQVGGIFDLTDPAQFTTMLVYTTTITGVFMLWKIVQPLNLYRTSLMLLITTLIILVSIYGREILELAVIDRQNILLLIILLQASYPMIAFVNNLLGKIRLDRVPIFNKLKDQFDR